MKDMKELTKTATSLVIATGLVFGVPLTAIATDKPSTAPIMVAEAKKASNSVAKPVYKPPRRGAPSAGRRIGGGTRGTNKSIPVLSVLAPDHTGLTVQKQPALYWFASTVVKGPIELTITDEEGITPVLEIKLPPPTQAGVQRVRLSDYDVQLASGQRYQWSVALILDPEHRSKDIIAMGAIERVNHTDVDSARFSDIPKSEAPSRYAQAGLWYDAVMAISELIESSPADIELRKQRASLLEQVGLSEIGAYDISAQSGAAG